MTDESDPYKLIRAAASRGNPTAAAYTAVLAALALGEARNWQLALQRLGAAAEMGSDLAQGQIRVLSGRSDVDAGWSEVASAIDLHSWAAPRELQPLSFDPQIATIAGLAPPTVCRWLIDRGAGRMTRAEADDRSNSSFDFAVNELDLIVVLLRLRIANSLRVNIDRLEALQLQHYAPGEMFAPRCDFLAPGSPQLERAGQRVTTVLVFLNDDYQGGETDFPELMTRHRGATGDALMFSNVDASVRPDPRTLHAGLPPAGGEKWLATQWIRER